MDIQSFTNTSAAKAGKSTDLKNILQSLQADGDEPLLDKNSFAKILVSVDASDSGLVLQPAESLVMPSASDAPLVPDVVTVLPPIFFNSTVALSRVDGGVDSFMDDFDSAVPVQAMKVSPQDISLSAAPFAAALGTTKAAPVALQTTPARLDKPEIPIAPALPFESLNLPHPLQSGSARLVSVTSSINEVPPLALNIPNTLNAPVAPNALIAPLSAAVPLLDVRGVAPLEQLIQMRPLNPRLDSSMTPAEVKAHAPASVGQTGLTSSSRKFTEAELSLSPRAEFSVLSDATRKNEVLLDILALGDGLVVQDGPLLAVKQVAYAFQRETDPAFSQNSTDLQSSRAAPTETTSVPEKNSAWVANGVQNVALTLDGLGDESVAVKISLSGLDTRIDIRTDHVVLRQMIEGSVQLMREQLSTEGLTLSTLSVGTTGQDQSLGQSAGKESQGRPPMPAVLGHESGRSPESLNASPNQKSPSRPKGDGGLSVFA